MNRPGRGTEAVLRGDAARGGPGDRQSASGTVGPMQPDRDAAINFVFAIGLSRHGDRAWRPSKGLPALPANSRVRRRTAPASLIARTKRWSSKEIAAHWMRDNVLELVKGMPEVMAGNLLIVGGKLVERCSTKAGTTPKLAP